MRQPSSTLAQVSAKAGCSPATVSRVLNNTGTVSNAVRQNVLKAVKESGYTPRRNQRTVRQVVAAANPEALKMTGNLFEVILHRYSPMEQLLMHDGSVELGPASQVSGQEMLSEKYSLSSGFYMQIISGVMDELANAKRRAMLQACDDLSAPALIESINRSEIAGVVLMGEYSPNLPFFLDRCKKPVVLVDIIHSGIPDVVTTDNMAGIGMAMVAGNSGLMAPFIPRLRGSRRLLPSIAVVSSPTLEEDSGGRLLTDEEPSASSGSSEKSETSGASSTSSSRSLLGAVAACNWKFAVAGRPAARAAASNASAALTSPRAVPAK